MAKLIIFIFEFFPQCSKSSNTTTHDSALCSSFRSSTRSSKSATPKSSTSRRTWSSRPRPPRVRQYCFNWWLPTWWTSRKPSVCIWRQSRVSVMKSTSHGAKSLWAQCPLCNWLGILCKWNQGSLETPIFMWPLRKKSITYREKTWTFWKNWTYS